MEQLVLDELKEDYQTTVKDLKRSLAKIRTGRANLGMLDGIKVEYYGQMSPLNQVATMKVADPRLITIQPWESDLIPEIERSISSSDLGLNPSNDGNIIRVPIPALTGERRQELTKVVKREGEDHKIALRNRRREANDQIKELEKESEITEDQMHRAFSKIDAMTDQFTSKIDQIVEDKTNEILEV
ncbi:ribosome recycling factor [Persicimonas caeni]|uniref:Ribosome-recycling factor n=1 Tax=Persicimonas caeni TaxID=2292766 RepID=A0A4Y6Q0L5_PERCE|nr:ribosome recycling factor [Persicimonas caeni]QDG53777.1 ribosome recycling factor [Persicimonas caeni]QED34998.1 ribosome recycling factor [Persicimonas caeni]